MGETLTIREPIHNIACSRCWQDGDTVGLVFHLSLPCFLSAVTPDFESCRGAQITLARPSH